jgi:hypothetical protein
MKGNRGRVAIIILLALVLLVGGLYAGIGYFLGQALERQGVREVAGRISARFLDANAGYLPLASDGLSISSPGFLAQTSPPSACVEIRASRLHARCNLIELWHHKWRIDNLLIQHLQAAYGPASAWFINRNEFVDPELTPPLQSDSPIEIDLHEIHIAKTDLFWGDTPEQGGGELRGVHTTLFPLDHNLVIQGTGGTFRQAKCPVASVQQFKLIYARPELRIDEGSLTFGGPSAITILGNFRLEPAGSFDLNLTFAHCPVAPFLGGVQRSKLEGEFDGMAHLQKETGQTESARAIGSIAITKAFLKNIAGLQHVADFTGREEFARLPVNQIRADYEWNWPILTVKNFVFESSRLIVVKGEFTIRGNKLDGEFQIGVSPDVVEKFPGAREEIFTRIDEGYLWTKLTVSGVPDQLREDLRPRLVRAAQNHFANGSVPPTFKPGQTIIEAIEGL